MPGLYKESANKALFRVQTQKKVPDAGGAFSKAPDAGGAFSKIPDKRRTACKLSKDLEQEAAVGAAGPF